MLSAAVGSCRAGKSGGGLSAGGGDACGGFFAAGRRKARFGRAANAIGRYVYPDTVITV